MKRTRVVLLLGCCVLFVLSVWDSWMAATSAGTNVRLIWTMAIFFAGRQFGLFDQQLKDLK